MLGAPPAAGARAVPDRAPRTAPGRAAPDLAPRAVPDSAPRKAAAPETGADNDPVGGALLASHGIIAPAGVKPPPKTEASAYVVADADTGAVLAAKDPHGHYLPASTLKTLTAVTLIPKLDKKRKVKPSDEACNVEGSAVGIVPEPIYTVDDLMRALLMVSANDAAVALAEANGGLKKTLADMNKEAHRLQAYDTVAKTPNGLDAPGQRSSAYDLALIARAGLAMPDFRKYISTKIAKFPAPKDYLKKNKKKRRDDADAEASESPPPAYYEMANHNRLLGRYKGMIGVKNGWTSKALGSFVGAARRDGHTILVVIMHHPGSFWEEVAKLLDWGFAVRGKATPVGRLVSPLPDHPKPSTLA
ncbi:MAG: D-alanyl-D-alanine carboxypeptidase, partial [Microbispora sp.]|nr:D-alanyl-D-alanine carboxypeptidase [Microbispora sp.]